MNVPQDFWAKAQEWGARTGADPKLLCAIAKHETNFGALGAGRQGYALGYGVYSPTNKDGRFQGLENQLNYAGQQIYRYFKGRPVTHDLLLGFGRDSWRAGDQSWAEKVWNWYTNLFPEEVKSPWPKIAEVNTRILPLIVRKGPGTNTADTGKRLKKGTRWQVWGLENGFYNLGGDQWGSAEYLKIVG